MKVNSLLPSRRVEELWLWFFPRRCVWCRGVTEPASMLCPACEPEAASRRLGGTLLPGTRTPLVSVFPYRSKVSGILLNFKFHGGRGYAHSIGYAMGDELMQAMVLPEDKTRDNPAGWLLCPVPMTAKQVKARGYNQSALLAQAAARWAGAAYAPGLLVKLRETQVQRSLPAAQREENVRDAFAAAQPKRIRGSKIVLCDDICTTGATLRACAKALEEAGAGEILCLTFLHTLEEKSDG